MKSNKALITMAAMLTCFGLARSAQALTSVELSLGAPITNGNQVQIAVELTYNDTDNPNTAVTGFQLDVSQSSALLTAGGTNFSRFTFTPSALLTNWSAFSDFSFGPLYAIGADTSIFPNDGLTQAGNVHQIGTLEVLLDGLPTGAYTVSIENSDLINFEGTLAFFQSPLDTQNPGLGLDPASEDLVNELSFGNAGSTTFSVEASTPSIPEPASSALALLAVLSLATRHLRSDRSTAK